jgi:hypothetical protein
LYYPFRLRWEDWLKNLNIPGDFYNVSELNNGLNNNWAPKDYFNSWRLYYAVQLRVNRGGTIINTKNRFQFLQSDYDESAIYSGEITHYKSNGTDSLFIGVNGDGVRENAIMPSEYTWVKALFTLSDPMGDVGDITKFYGVIRMEEFQGAGSTSADMMSSVLANETAVNKLIPLAGETGTKLTKVSDTEILAECLIDYTKLDITKTYKTSATIRCKGLRAGKYNFQYTKQYD